MSNGYRQKCISAKGEACKACGEERNIVAHHIDGDRTNNDLENLIPLCKSCHKTIHSSELVLDDLLSEDWPRDLGEEEDVRVTVTIPRSLKEDVEELADDTGLSLAQAGGNLIEQSMRGGSEDSVENEPSQYVQHLEQEVEFLRQLIRDSV